MYIISQSAILLTKYIIFMYNVYSRLENVKGYRNNKVGLKIIETMTGYISI